MKNPIPSFFAAKKATALELFVYDVIGDDWCGITAKDVQAAIRSADKFDSINVHVNSPGGDCFEGTAIFNIIRQAAVPVTVIVEGIAASAAFTIAMAGDTIQACDGATMMLHNAWCFAVGNAAELRRVADFSEKTSNSMGEIYSKRSGLSVAEVQSLMNAETYLNADEAVAKGFATEKLSTTPEQSKAAKALIAQFDAKLGKDKVAAKLPASIAALVAKAKKEKAATSDCECPCDPCQGGDCEGCTDDPCDCQGCTCPNHQDPAAKAATDAHIQALHNTMQREIEIASL